MATPGLSIVFLTYNRADLLDRACRSVATALKDRAGWATEIIISDDGSSANQRALIAQIPADLRLFSDNGGLSANHNRAIAACSFDRILSLQDDWEYVGTLDTIAAAMAVLDEDGEVGCVNFLPPPEPLEGEQRQTRSGYSYFVFANDGRPEIRACGERPYSDRPHLKRRSFARDLGPYREDLPMTKAELEFQCRVASQTNWKIAYLMVPASFAHLGASRSFNPGALRQARVERIQALPVLGPAYRWTRTAAKRLLILLRLRR